MIARYTTLFALTTISDSSARWRSGTFPLPEDTGGEPAKIDLFLRIDARARTCDHLTDRKAVHSAAAVGGSDCKATGLDKSRGGLARGRIT